jgi:hypothetical protein
MVMMVTVRWRQAELCRQAHLIKVNGACKVTVRPDTSSVNVPVVLFQIFLNSSALSVSRSCAPKSPEDWRSGASGTGLPLRSIHPAWVNKGQMPARQASKAPDLFMLFLLIFGQKA